MTGLSDLSDSETPSCASHAVLNPCATRGALIVLHSPGSVLQASRENKIKMSLFNPVNELWQPPSDTEPFHRAVEVDNTEIKGQRKELPYLENELWHKIFALTDLETCRANNRVAFYDMLCRDLVAAWKFLTFDFKTHVFECEPLKPPQDWPMIILLIRNNKIADSYRPLLCDLMASYQDPILLKEARRAGYPWSDDAITTAVIHGSLQCLKWACENGCMKNTSDTSCTELAAELGYLDILQYLHETGFRWHEHTMACALYKGYLACLKYAHENGCPWTSSLYKKARSAKLARDAGRTYSGWGEEREQSACIQYILDCGCPST